MATSLFSDIEYLKGVGKARGEKYRKLGITSPYELIYHIPRNYLDFRAYVPILQAETGSYNVLKLTVTGKNFPQKIKGGLIICNASATDGISQINITFFNNVYAFNALKTGETYYMYGKVSGNIIRRDISSPVWRRRAFSALILLNGK